MNKKKKEKIYNICAFWVILDQVIKLMITMQMKPYQKIRIIPGFFQLFYTKNDGAAFSSFSGMRYLLIIVSLLAFLILIHYIKKTRIQKKIGILSLGLLLGGLVGNLIDRLLYGYVIDYLSFTIFGYSFAVFNFADMGIVIGVFLFLIYVVKEEFKSKS